MSTTVDETSIGGDGQEEAGWPFPAWDRPVVVGGHV